MRRGVCAGAVQQEFVVRGLASLATARERGDYRMLEQVIASLRDRLDAARVNSI